MQNTRRAALMLIFALSLVACSYPGVGGSPEPTGPQGGPENTATVPARPPTETSAPATDVIPAPQDRPQEAIMILEPGPGSRLTSPFTVRGVADPTFEQTLAARVVDASGSTWIEQPLMIQAPLGERGAFEGEMDLPVSEQTNVFLQVYATSARDGGITHLESVGLTLMPDGPPEIVQRSPYPERIVIYDPEPGQQISAGVVHVEGFGVASFEGTLVLELYDVGGAKLGSTPIIVESPDMGKPGQFSGDVSYSVTEEMPARLVVVDPLPTGNGVNHIASVEIQLAP